MNQRVPLYYTFGNHMHWVDMEWLWGYHVLPGSVRDMLHFCRETGAKGNVNFDGVGYEKLAAEDPETLAELREAVRSGVIEPVGCSYGQPYGLFHGGESNVRQLLYGARTVRRLLGVWPKTFWEEEFYFFPQLPQMLRGCGFEFASLFFQWTWHTPEVPWEDVPVVWWEGVDGSRLLCATRNKLNVHQWPEDLEAVLQGLGARGQGLGQGENDSDLTPSPQPLTPLLLQWLELMPSPDWMCRSEVLLPKMRELLADERFEIKFATLGEYLCPLPSEGEGAGGAGIPVRRYTMDQVWHGLTLGKNGDDMRRRSLEAESRILLAETMATIAGALGRPYAQWDVYPTWELEEAWRELLVAQHHDNDECEGLCGRIGKRQYERALGMADDLVKLQMNRLFPEDSPWKWENMFTFNPFGWRCYGRDGQRSIPAFSIMPWRLEKRATGKCLILDEEKNVVTTGPNDMMLRAEFDLARGGISSLQRSAGHEVVPEGQVIGRLLVGEDAVQASLVSQYDVDGQYVVATYSLGEDSEFSLHIDRSHPHDGLDIEFAWDHHELLKLVKPGFQGALTIEVPLPWQEVEVHADTPYAVHKVGTGSSGVRKYPEGDWMTSPQWFEPVERAFTAQNFVDIVDPRTGEGLLIAHRGNQQWFRHDGALRCALSAEDPWDEDFYRTRMASDQWVGNAWRFEGSFRFIPHGPIDNAERWKIGQEFRRNHFLHPTHVGGDNISPWGRQFIFADIEPHHVVMSALYRESDDRGTGVENFAGVGMGHPTVIRLVELNGVAATAEIEISGEVAKAFKTNLLGGIEACLGVFGGGRLRHPLTGVSSQIKVPMKPYEIATIYLDIVEGRKQPRDLDAKREVWATVHRRETSDS